MSFCCTELPGMVRLLPLSTPIVITKDQQLQWSRVEITYLEDILNKVGRVSPKHSPSSFLSVVLKFLSENYDKDTRIINANRVFQKAWLLIFYKFPPWGFEADQKFDNKYKQKLGSILFCVWSQRTSKRKENWQMSYCVSKSSTEFYGILRNTSTYPRTLKHLQRCFACD